jgi:hypothetical protein
MTLSQGQKILTAVVTAFVVLAIGGAVARDSRVGVATLTFVFLALGISWAMSPREIVVESGELRIERRAWMPLRVSLASIVSASPLDRLGAGTIRVFGVGGFFGSYGLFHNEALGRFRLYATRSGQAVLVKRTGSDLPLVLTPDDVAGTIGALDRRPTESY